MSIRHDVCSPSSQPCTGKAEGNGNRKGPLYIQSAGVTKGTLDPFTIAVLEEIGIDAGKHKPRTIEELDDWEGLNFDLIISLSPEAHHKALDLTRTVSADVEYWPLPDPSLTQGSRDQMLDAYRAVRDQLVQKITARLRD
ncbi:MAG: low molecular weight phosphatase family protein [Rhizobiales bacterium]|nr:low molecular weight phosphatase family protein [Hyphomicrobiales bacterium]